MPYVGPQHNHAKSALRGACAAWVVGQYSAGRKVREPRVTGFKRDGHERSYHVPRPVAVLVRPSPGRQRGEERALRWPTTQPRQVSALRGARAASVAGKTSTGLQARGPRATGYERDAKHFRTRCR